MNKINFGLSVVAVVIAIYSVFLSATAPVAAPAPVAGGTSNYDSIALSIPASGTSSITRAGCIGVFATSTATPIILTFTNSGTTTITGNATSNGSLAWQYGTCPSSAGL